MTSEQEEQPEKIPRPILFCHSCGERGKVFEFPESIAVRDEVGESELDLPFFRCENCGAKWYEHNHRGGRDPYGFEAVF